MTLDYGCTSGYRQVAMFFTWSLVHPETLHRLSCFYPRKKARLGVKRKSHRQARRPISSAFRITWVATRVVISLNTFLEVLNSMQLELNMFDMFEHRMKKPWFHIKTWGYLLKQKWKIILSLHSFFTLTGVFFLLLHVQWCFGCIDFRAHSTVHSSFKWRY